MLCESHRPVGARPRPSAPLAPVQLMLEREIEALATSRSCDGGLRLRVLMRMLDQLRPTG